VEFCDVLPESPCDKSGVSDLDVAGAASAFFFPRPILSNMAVVCSEIMIGRPKNPETMGDFEHFDEAETERHDQTVTGPNASKMIDFSQPRERMIRNIFFGLNSISMNLQ
jgi:hypothetical protein